MRQVVRFATLVAVVATTATAFTTHPSLIQQGRQSSSTSLGGDSSRRDFFGQAAANFVAGMGLSFGVQPASASVFLDPAMYGDQELRNAAIDSLKEAVRRAILQSPELAPAFYQLALLDSLSFSSSTKEFGPDGSVVKAVLNTKASTRYIEDLQKCANTLIEAGIALRKYTAITIGDAVAIGGAEAIESIGGPSLSVQLGRTDPGKKGPIPNTVQLDLFDGNQSPTTVAKAFKNAGLTEREMTALLSALLTLERVEKTRSTEQWKASTRPKFREAGKMGRMSEFKRLTDEDIAMMEEAEDAEEESDFYIADSFGSKDQAYGQRVGQDINEQTFNKFVKELNEFSVKKKGKSGSEDLGWIADILLDEDNPTTQSWLNKYAGSNLAFLKDLKVAYMSTTQLGAEFTGGKYENLLKNKPRKSLNDDDLDLFG
eukprot:CAMPEP_0194029792 /NCGR_PEP_ID=MMETSP0009_2-20130614/3438_1 /TAXON_ID=210454 /ORGANISM="Grammatophora oceanica, Strain CCMP 410" /LENGTH=428 /DNA_ID=CAMNT_0038669567 /DNA_START=118 /DNA_END=1404 /DNA_ORIENTATION=+